MVLIKKSLMNIKAEIGSTRLGSATESEAYLAAFALAGSIVGGHHICGT